MRLNSRESTSRLETTILAYSQISPADLHKLLLVISRSCTRDSIFPCKITHAKALLNTKIMIKTKNNKSTA